MHQKSKSSFSLPKIKEIPEEESDRQNIHQKLSTSRIIFNPKPLKEIHRPKWGMVPKCLVKGHQGKEVLYVCIHPDCQNITRLICEQCFFNEHSVHSTSCLAIDQIKCAEIEKLRYWPFGEQFKGMFQFVAKHQSYVNNIVQDVNATFNEMSVRIMNSIDKIRLQMLKKIDTFYIKETKKKAFSEEIKSQLLESFSLKKIQKIVSELFNKKLRHEVFLKKMQNLLKDEQIIKKQNKLLDYFDKADKGIDMQFDKQSFQKKEDWILNNIANQVESMKEVDVVIGDQKSMQKIIPETLKYLESAIKGHKDLKFERRILEDTSQYVGFIEKNQRVIIGCRKFKTGFSYYGEWSNGNRNGWGIAESKSTGYRYIGDWKQDRKHGFGRQETLVTIYEGQFEQDKKQGFGVLIKDGNRYEITWKGDKMHGEGKVILADGNEQQIYYINGNETEMKKHSSGSGGVGMSLTQLTRRFSKKQKSIVSTADTA